MKTLKNRTILIGRDPEKPRLLAAISVGGKMKLVAIDNAVIPSSISRLQASANSAHCKIDVDNNAEMTITNLKDTNITVVDGVSVVSRRITLSSKITLGKDDYVLDINKVVSAVKSAIGVDITPLKRVWEEYEAMGDAITKKQQDLNRRRMLPMLIGVGTTVLTGILHMFLEKEDSSTAMFITLPIAIISLIICVKNYRQKDTSVQDRKKAKDWFTDNYVCPACKKFMGSEEYKLLAQKGKCPRCGAEFLQE